MIRFAVTVRGLDSYTATEILYYFPLFFNGRIGFFPYHILDGDGLIFYNNRLGRNRLIVALVGGFLCFAVYGFIVDSSSALFFSSPLSLKTVMPIYISGISFNAIHGVSTFVFLLIATPYIKDTFDRLAKKYELFGAKRKG